MKEKMKLNLQVYFSNLLSKKQDRPEIILLKWPISEKGLSTSFIVFDKFGKLILFSRYHHKKSEHTQLVWWAQSRKEIFDIFQGEL